MSPKENVYDITSYKTLYTCMIDVDMKRKENKLLYIIYLYSLLAMNLLES